MDVLERFVASAPRPVVTGGAGTQPDDGVARLVDSAAVLAQEVGRGIAHARNWISNVALEKYPLTTLGMAFGLGVFAGWFVKRR